jgi:malate dehydrogenase (oxaloacetate-decarboxylating)(NADP+)
MESGVAKTLITDWEAYNLELQERIGIDQRLMLRVVTRAKKDPKRVVFAEADNVKILKASQLLKMKG